MAKTLLVAQREYLENLRTKTFWIGILFMPVLIVVSFTVPFILEKAKDVRRYTVIDHSGWLAESIFRQIEGPDTRKVFEEILARGATGGETTESEAEDPEPKREPRIESPLPPELMQLYPVLSMVDRAGELERLANQIDRLRTPEGSEWLANLPPDLLPPELDIEKAHEAFLETFERLHDWWSELPEEEQESLLGTESPGQYRREVFEDLGEDPLEALNEKLRDGEIFAYFVIAEGVERGQGKSLYVSQNRSDPALRRWFERMAASKIRDRVIEESQVDPRVADLIRNPIDFEETRLSEEGKVEKATGEDTLRQFVPVAFVYLLWIAIFTMAQMLLTNTVEEKSNRILEVLLSSISPLQIMMGKIFGIAATGLTVLGSWVFFLILALKLAPHFFAEAPDFDFMVVIDDPLYLSSFLGYFLLGFLFHASILAGLGSVCTSIKEAQNLMMPVTLLLMLPLLAMLPIAKDPNGTLARVLSFVPPFTPFVMMNRAAGPPELWEYILTTVLMVVSVIGAMWAAARVFRVGILLTGKPPRLFEILRWLRAHVDDMPEIPDHDE